MRSKGTGGVYRVPKDRKLPLKYWTGTIELPRVNGKRNKHTIRCKDKAELLRLIDEARAQLAKKGKLPSANQTVEQWFEHWFNDIALKELKPKSANTYRGIIQNHIIPTIGTVKLTKLTADHIRAVHDAITDKGLSSSTAQYAHAIMSTAFGTAEIDGRMTRNPAADVKKPRAAATNLVALNAEEGIRILLHVANDRLGSRWAAALFTAARQGELLGLTWDRVRFDGDRSTINLSWQLQRLSWEHGCNGTCERKRGTDCPDRKLTFPADAEYRNITGGLWWSRPKSEAGWRTVPLVEPLLSILERRYEISRTEPNPHNLVWTADPKRTRHGVELPLDGSPLDPAVDQRAWDALLKAAQLPDVRVHDLRHTAVDLLYQAGVPEVIIMEIVGHASRAVSRAYRSKENEAQMRAELKRAAGQLAIEPSG